MRVMRACGIILSALFLISYLSGCGQGKSRLEKGFDLMASARFDEAHEEFSAILEKSDLAEAYFGRGLSDLMITLSILDYVYTLVGGHPSEQEFSPFSARDENEFLYNLLHSILTDIRNTVHEGYSDLLKVSDVEDFSFQIKDLPVRLGRKEVFNLRGKWTSADVSLLASFLGLISGIFDLILSQNLKADYFSLFEYAKPIFLAGGIDPGDPLKPVSLPSLLNIIVYLFEQSPDFLALDPNDRDSNGINDGTEMWNSGASAFSKSAGLFHTGLEKCMEDQSGHYFSFADGELKLITYKDPKSGNETAVTLAINDEFLNAVSAVKDAFEDPTTFVLWKAHITPIIASLAVAVSPFIKTLSSIIPQETDPQTAYKLIKNLLDPIFENSLALQPAQFFSEPRSFRSFLPIWNASFPDPLSWNFAFEWECSEYAPPPGDTSNFPSGGFFCSTFPFKDSPHFTDEFFSSKISSTLPDGITSYAPYIPWGDPSFGKLLYTDVYSIKDKFPYPATIQTNIDTGPGLKPATQGELNALVQYLFNFALQIPGVKDLLIPSQ